MELHVRFITLPCILCSGQIDGYILVCQAEAHRYLDKGLNGTVGNQADRFDKHILKNRFHFEFSNFFTTFHLLLFELLQI